MTEKRKKLEKQLPLTLPKEGAPSQVEWTRDSCPYREKDRIVLYGAGKWGPLYYQWICENRWGRVAGWVDNFWYRKSHLGYPVSPLDLLLKISYDYVLIAIENKTVQDEVAGNLICWGVPEEKLLLI